MKKESQMVQQSSPDVFFFLHPQRQQIDPTLMHAVFKFFHEEKETQSAYEGKRGAEQLPVMKNQQGAASHSLSGHISV